MRKNPFGDESSGAQKSNPFGDVEAAITPAEAATRIEQSARKIRNLRSQLGAEGLTLPATRELIDEVATALEASARAIRQLRG
ncbi:MAG: hypothetical protein ACREMA_12160 [Longimicrobiales bacterium]